MDLTTLKTATVRGMAITRPFKDPAQFMRIALAMLIVCVWGLLTDNPDAQRLMAIGVMVSSTAGLVPYNRSRLSATVWTMLGYTVVTAVGMAVGTNWWIVLPVAAVGLFVAGMLSAASASLNMRVMLSVIVFIAFAELSDTYGDAGEAFMYYMVGTGVTLACLCLPPYNATDSGRRTRVAGLYTALTAGSLSGAALLDADRSLTGSRHDPKLPRLVGLTRQAEQIGQLLLALDTPEGHADGTQAWCDTARRRAGGVGALILGKTNRRGDVPAPWPTTADGPESPATPACHALKDAVTDAEHLAAGRGNPGTDNAAGVPVRPAPSTLDLVHAELHPSSPIFQHAVRLTVLCLVGQVLGVTIGHLMGSDNFLTGHGFWVPLTIALMMMPEHGVSLARGFGRSIGTLIGAVLGIALTSLPDTPVLHTVLLVVLFWGYMAFQTSGQPWVMVWVVPWMAVVTGGTLGATTRALDTILGALLAVIVIALLPTWQSRLLTPRFTTWAHAEADYLDALARLWEDDSEPDRSTVAQAAVQSRSARCAFTASAQTAFTEPPDKTGVWPHSVLTPAADAVLTVSRRTAALEALAPQWDDAQRGYAVTVVRALARNVRTLLTGDAGGRKISVAGSVPADPVVDAAAGGGIAPAVIATTDALHTLDTTVGVKIRAR